MVGHFSSIQKMTEKGSFQKGGNYYDIDALIAHLIKRHIDISPNDEKEWKMFCCALKVLGYSANDLFLLSHCREIDCQKAWRDHKHPETYKSEKQARGMIINLAKKNRRINLSKFILSPDKRKADDEDSHPDRQSRPPEPTAKVLPRYISTKELSMTEQFSRETSLYVFLSRLFPDADICRVFGNYHIGGSKYVNPQGGRAISYPYIGGDGRCIDCKIMAYNPETGSRKTAHPLRSYTATDGEVREVKTTWALSEMRESHRRADWCNFGDHLAVSRPDDGVAVVESEKSAVVLSMVYPKQVWIAVGSLSNLNATRLSPYKGRRITLYPDRDGIRRWREVAKDLIADGYCVSVDTTISRYEGDPKDDLADVVLRIKQGIQLPPTEDPTCPEPSPHQKQLNAIWEDWQRRHPSLKRLNDLFNLTPISAEPMTIDK